MVKSNGKCRIDSVMVGELTVDTTTGHPKISVSYALVASDSGERFGKGNINTLWSDATFEKLKELLTSIETDVANVVFSEGATTASVETGADTTTDGVASL